jgi:hypothetical protein
MEAQSPPPVEAPLARVLVIEPVTWNGDRDLAYWTSVDTDPLMIVLVEAIDSTEPPTVELLSDVRAGAIMSNVFPFSTLALALAFADQETDNGDASCIVFAKRIDEPAYGERGPGLHAGIDSPALVSIWCDGFIEGGKAPGGRSPNDADQAVADELERLGIDGIVTCEFPSVIGVSNDAAAAGVLVTKLVALSTGGIPIVGFEIKRNMIAVRSKRPLTFDEHKAIGDVCREYSVAVLGVPTRAPAGSYLHEPLMDPRGVG